MRSAGTSGQLAISAGLSGYSTARARSARNSSCIVFASSSAQTSAWLTDLGVGPSPVRAIPIQDVAPGVAVEGPVPGLDDEVHELHRRYRLNR